MNITYTVEFSSLGKLTAQEYALAIVRMEEMKSLYPATVTQAPQAQREFVQTVAEHPLATFYKAKTGEKKAAVSAIDAERFTRTKERVGYAVAKGVEVPLEVKIAVWKGRLLERGLATIEEIESAIESAGNVAMNETLPEIETMEGDAERGMDSL